MRFNTGKEQLERVNNSRYVTLLHHYSKTTQWFLKKQLEKTNADSVRREESYSKESKHDISEIPLRPAPCPTENDNQSPSDCSVRNIVFSWEKGCTAPFFDTRYGISLVGCSHVACFFGDSQIHGRKVTRRTFWWGIANF
jgi:hypothetical protein